MVSHGIPKEIHKPKLMAAFTDARTPNTEDRLHDAKTNRCGFCMRVLSSSTAISNHIKKCCHNPDARGNGVVTIRQLNAVPDITSKWKLLVNVQSAKAYATQQQIESIGQPFIEAWRGAIVTPREKLLCGAECNLNAISKNEMSHLDCIIGFLVAVGQKDLNSVMDNQHIPDAIIGWARARNVQAARQSQLVAMCRKICIWRVELKNQQIAEKTAGNTIHSNNHTIPI